MRGGIFAVAIAACVASQAYAQETRTAGVGDLIYNVDVTEPLPNAFGGADIFGRKRVIGRIEVRFIGLDDQGRAVFHRKDTSILNTETTMSRGPAVASVYGNGPNATIVASRPDPGTVQALDPSTTEVRVDLAVDPVMLVNGTEIRIVSASASRVTYVAPPKRR